MIEEYLFEVSGLRVEAQFDTRERDGIFLPLLRHLSALRARTGRRVTAFLAAPPGAGKSTLGRYLELLAREYGDIAPVQCLALDGFHLPNAVLEARSIERDGRIVTLKAVKGAPETFDVAALKALLARIDAPGLRWPAYDRRLHEPVPDAVAVTGEVLIIEGNWLLLDEAPWNSLSCDLSVFLRPEADSLLERLIARKIAGGLSREEARAFSERSDMWNVRYCLEHSRRADVELVRRDGVWAAAPD